MKNNWKKILSFAAAGILALSAVGCGGMVDNGGNGGGGNANVGGNSGVDTPSENNGPSILQNLTQAKNVILMIGDGMGPEQIKAGELYKGEKLTMQNFPYMTKVETRSHSDEVTDSAAAATAMATGKRTTNGIIGRSHDYQDLETIVDIASAMGKRTGVLATEELYGATPMGFSAHAYTRGDQAGLLDSAATTSNVNLFASYTMSEAYQSKFTNAGYTAVADVAAISDATGEKVFGSYNIKGTAPSMSAAEDNVAFDRLVTEALEYLSKDEDGFFLMAEGSHIDHGGHNNDFCYMLEELMAFDDAVAAALKWAESRNDTVVIVLADHETGGLALTDEATHETIVETYEAGGYGNTYSWSTGGHTSTDINCYINGANIDFRNYSFASSARIKNTDVFKIIKSLFNGA